MSKKLNKNTFMQGAFIATLGIVISKILGMLYVIPFYAIIGETGGALYGYAYNIYSIFQIGTFLWQPPLSADNAPPRTRRNYAKGSPAFAEGPLVWFLSVVISTSFVYGLCIGPEAAPA